MRSIRWGHWTGKEDDNSDDERRGGRSNGSNQLASNIPAGVRGPAELQAKGLTAWHWWSCQPQQLWWGQRHWHIPLCLYQSVSLYISLPIPLALFSLLSTSAFSLHYLFLCVSALYFRHIQSCHYIVSVKGQKVEGFMSLKRKIQIRWR